MTGFPASHSPFESTVKKTVILRNRQNPRLKTTSLLGIGLALVVLMALAVSAPQSHAQRPQSVRTPLGVYAHISIEDALNAYKGATPATSEDLHRYMQKTFTGLLTDPAISGLTVGQHWDHIQPDDPFCVFTNSCADGPGGYDWSYLDDAFAAANAAHKSVQLLINPGVESPQWLMDRLPSCDGLFTGEGTAPFDCGKVTFQNFPEQAHADSADPPLPLPWNPVYIFAWDDFLFHLSARYSSNPALTYIAMAGPICASTEIIFPTTAYGSTQLSGMQADKAWRVLIQHSFPFAPGYADSDQVFIDAWKQAIDAYEWIFSGVTLVISPDDGDALPEQPYPVHVHRDNFLYGVDCSTATTDQMSCEAKTEILSYFVAARGRNEKSSQVGGMRAGSNIYTGNIGVPGLKVLTSLTPPPRPPILGGAEFDFQVSLPGSMLQQGCPDYSAKDPDPTDCKNLDPETAAFNTFTVFFDGTPAAGDFGGASSIPPIDNAPIQYVEVDWDDVQYAQDPKHQCQTFADGTSGPPSLQDWYNLASYDLYTMAGKAATLPPTTCPGP
jgi:hypothetical protein